MTLNATLITTIALTLVLSAIAIYRTQLPANRRRHCSPAVPILMAVVAWALTLVLLTRINP